MSPSFELQPGHRELLKKALDKNAARLRGTAFLTRFTQPDGTYVEDIVIIEDSGQVTTTSETTQLAITAWVNGLSRMLDGAGLFTPSPSIINTATPLEPHLQDTVFGRRILTKLKWAKITTLEELRAAAKEAGGFEHLDTIKGIGPKSLTVLSILRHRLEDPLSDSD